MADFIAVIRRAVDGLSDNTPEMRAKVYDKARAAVQRQLDNMRPRPADDMIARQMTKLSDAIESVEADFREPDTGLPDAAPEPALELAEEAPVHDGHVHGHAVEDDHPAASQPEAGFEPPHHASESETAASASFEEPEDEAEPESETGSEDHASAAESADAYSDAEHYGDATSRDDHGDAPEFGEDTAASHVPLDHQAPHYYEDEPVEMAPADEPARHVPPVFDDARDEPATESWHGEVQDAPFDEPVDLFAVPPASEPVARHDIDHQEIERSAEKQNPPSWDIEAVEDPWHEEREDLTLAPNAPSVQVENRGEWENFEKIIGIDRAGAAGSGLPRPGKLDPRGRQPSSEDDSKVAQVVGRLRENSGKPAVASERRGSGKVIGAIVGVVLVLAGVSYLGWRFSDNILNFVNGSSQSVTKASTPSSDTGTQQASTPATAPASSGAAPAGQQADATQPATIAGPEKFTQRLMSDGSETDPGSANEQPAIAGAKEGTSVAAQTEKPAEAAASAPAATAKDTAAVANAPPQNAEKMFLYEERIGQASPTALEGTTVWTEQTDSESGSNSKMIQANIAIPGRNMSAIITFKRNMDKSLPASHIIELTFSLPKDFEGGGIENVLRISMKQKEQDQGTPLVGVPAKITDYFHMVALNAFPDAVKSNMALLKDRDWIDIPITYTNGRRALLTLQKGTEGKKIFDEVLASWENAPPVQ